MLKHLTMFTFYRIGAVLVITYLILKCVVVEGKRQNIRDQYKPQYRDYSPDKWTSNSAMDVWYGNKSTIEVISREFADIMYKLTARPVRSVLRHRTENENGTTIHQEILTKQVSRVDINFINTDNSTFHTIRLQPMKQVVNNSKVLKFLEPLLGMD